MESNARSPHPHDGDSAADVAFSSRGCCCFWIPWSDDRPSASWERIRTSESTPVAASPAGTTDIAGRWWKAGVRTLMKVREWSEIVAGPRWKTFIRRFNRSSRHGGGHGKRFGYDPLSYALNFDEGNDGSPDGESGYRDFSARFVAPPISGKLSMDLGGRDAPSLFAPSQAAISVAN